MKLSDLPTADEIHEADMADPEYRREYERTREEAAAELRKLVADSRKHDLIFPCDCGDDHFLRLSWWDDDAGFGPSGEIDGYLHLGGNFWSRLRTRPRAVWRLLTGRHYETYVGVVLDGGMAREIAAHLTVFADACDRAAADRVGASPRDPAATGTEASDG